MYHSQIEKIYILHGEKRKEKSNNQTRQNCNEGKKKRTQIASFENRPLSNGVFVFLYLNVV